MKKLLVAVLAAASLSACGLAEEIAKLQAGKLDAAKVSATGYTLAKSIQDVQSLSGGLNGLVPKMSDGGGVGLAPAMRLAPSLAPLANEQCPATGSFPQVVTYTETKETFPAEAEETKTVTSINLLCNSAGAAPYVISAHVEGWYKDDSTAVANAVELDASDITTKDDLLAGLSGLVYTRYFAEGDERKQFTLELDIDFDGAMEAPNLLHRGKFTVAMRNGTTVVAEVIPETPLADGEEFTQGTATRTTTYAEGDLKITTETAEVTGKDIGTYHVVNEYADGTKDDVTISSDGNVITLSATGHDGYTRSGSLQLASGAYSLVTSFPQGSPIQTVTESGTWHKGSTSGTYARTVVWADGHTSQSNATITVGENSLSATFKHEENINDGSVSDAITGKIDIIKKADLSTTLTIEVSNGDGDKAVLDGVKYADGTAKLHFTLDLVATPENPDQEGDFIFAADGTGTGKITVKEAGVTKELTLTVRAGE